MALYDITALSTPLEFDTTSGNAKYIARLSDTRVVVVWARSTTAKYVQTFEVNRSTGVITANGSPEALIGGTETWSLPPSIAVIDSTNFIVTWYKSGPSEQTMQAFSVNAGTGAITALGGLTDLSTTQGASAVLMSSDGTTARVLVTYLSGADGVGVIASVTISTGAITLTGTPHVFSSAAAFLSVSKINATKALVTYRGASSDGFSRVLDINTSTWAVSNAGSEFEWLNSSTINQNSLEIMDETAVVALNAFDNNVNFGVRQLSVNPSTWAITNLGTPITSISTVAQNAAQRVLVKIDSEHFALFYAGAGNDGFVETYSLNLSTGALSMIDQLEFDTSDGDFNSAVYLNEGLIINAWQGPSSDGFIQAFQVEVPASFTPTPMMHHMAITGGLM